MNKQRVAVFLCPDLKDLMNSRDVLEFKQADVAHIIFFVTFYAMGNGFCDQNTVASRKIIRGNTSIHLYKILPLETFDPEGNVYIGSVAISVRAEANGAEMDPESQMDLRPIGYL